MYITLKDVHLCFRNIPFCITSKKYLLFCFKIVTDVIIIRIITKTNIKICKNNEDVANDDDGDALLLPYIIKRIEFSLLINSVLQWNKKKTKQQCLHSNLIND